jgi:UDP-N-acetyl-D-mannosaminuronic acid dehydrogenase
MAKLVENSYRDVNIAFANELSVISAKLGINVWELIRLANHHPRVDILQPGPGVGGHCIAVDPWFIVAAAPAESRLIRTARTVNDDKPRWVLDQVHAAFAKLPKNAEVALLGLAFKANIDDLRESPAIEIAQAIAESMTGIRINVAEPHIDSLPGSLQRQDNVRLVPLEEAVSRSSLVVVLVDHDAVRALPREVLAGKLLVDTRGVFSS